MEYAGKNPGLTLNLILIAGIAFAGFKLYQFVAGDQAKEKKERDKQDQDSLNFSISTNKLTRSEEDLKLITNQVFQAMNRYGTDEKTILSNLNMLEREDLLFVIKHFGFRLYNGAAEATTWVDINMFSQKLDLMGWLKEELSGNALKEVESVFDKHNIPF